MDTELDFRDTPSLLIDLDRLEANLVEMADVARRNGLRLRPHVKTHKSPWLARRQLDHGASGVTVAKLGEAEIMAAAGIRDIRIAYPIVGEYKLERLARLMDQADVSIALDSVDAAMQIGRIGAVRSQHVPILLEIDTGLGRLGVRSEDAVSAAAAIAQTPGVRLTGILTHEGHAYDVGTRESAERCAIEAGELMVRTAAALRSAGFDITEVSVGCTPAARDIAQVPGITEMRPGTYIFNDASEIAAGVATIDSCALTVLATVVSIPTDDRAIIDAGAKTLASDTIRAVGPGNHGIVKGLPDATLFRLNEEHGFLRLPHARHRLSVGQRIEIVPNHVCPVVNLADWMYLMRRGQCEGVIPVTARGKNR